ncbi:MAG: GntP family permease [Clostridiales bacterium]|nr:GntP family permease [Clostridiales bacterium]
MTALGLIGLFAAIAFLVVLAFKGHSVIIAAPLAAMIAVLFSYGLQGHFMAQYTLTYMSGFANYAKSYFPIYLLGAVFAKLMDVTGCATAIAKFFSEKLGTKRAILSVVITCAILTYGGVSLFVVAFVVLPVAIILFREANVPKRLIPGCIALGAFTFTMTALPGSPQVQNTIPMTYFGTDSWAAPGLGIIAAAIMFAGGMVWLTWRYRKAVKKGEGYGDHDDNVEKLPDDQIPNIVMAFAPIVIILVLNLVLSKVIYPRMDGAYLVEQFDTTLDANSGTWSVLLAMMASILFMIFVNLKKLKGIFVGKIKDAAQESLMPLINSCAVVGFGSITKALPIFLIIQTFVLSFTAMPLLSEVLSVNVLCGMTASASGGLGAALEAMGDTFLSYGIDPGVLHRVASIASGGLDNLPYNGATVTVLALCGMTHKDSYLDMFVVAMVIPIVTSLIIVVLASFGMAI